MLALLDRELDASEQRGSLVLVLGEAGVGKTTLVDAWARSRADRIRLLLGACDGSATPRPLGPLLDALPGLTPTADRTELVASTLDHLLPSDPRRVLVVEDLHWADEATLDVVRALAVRLPATPSLVILTARSDEVEPGTPLATLIGDLVRRPDVTRIALEPLTLAGVRRLVDTSGVAIDPGALFRRTGGNAFHTTEILASGVDELPASVRDAVLARVARLSPDARASLDVVSLTGLRAELDLLADVLGDRADAVDEAVRRGVLVDVGDGLRFRHELARIAVADDVAPMRHVAIHRAILRWLLDLDGSDPSRVAHHAEAAGDHATAYRASIEAGRQSALLSAHREAVLQYERALRLAPRDAEGRVELLEALSYEQYLTGLIDDAISSRAQALVLHQAADDRLGIVSGHRWLSRLQWFAANGPAAREHARRAVDLLRPDDRSYEAAMALSNMAQLCMLGADLDGARDWGGRALAMARELGADDVISHALNNIGTAELEAGYDDGEAMLLESLDVALAGDLQEHAARAYTNLVSTATARHRPADAERYLETALPYCAERDLDSWAEYMTSHLALTRLEQGRWDDALEAADRVLADVRSAPVTRLNALLVRGLTQLRTGDPRATETLAEARHVADSSDEVQRLAPVAAAEAEAAWLAERELPDSVLAAYAATQAASARGYRDDLAIWLARFDQLADGVSAERQACARELEGRYAEAAAAWNEQGCAFAAALALGFSSDADDLAASVRRLTDLRATATAARVARRAAAFGARVPRPRRTTTREHPAGLTSREADVLALLAQGRTNSEMADELSLSRRTVEHHVAAVLAKLDVSSRREAVEVAAQRGWTAI